MEKADPESKYKKSDLARCLLYIEPGPVVLVSSYDSESKKPHLNQNKKLTFQSLNPFLLRSLLNPSKIPYLNPTTIPYTVPNPKSKTIK